MARTFRNDYSEGAHKEILKAVLKVNEEQNIGYGLDKHSKRAEKYILDKFNCKDGKVFFLTGGTQVNMTVISYLLKPYEGVISCDTGHINVHETAAVEGSGHKVIVCPNDNGKLTAKRVLETYQKYTDEHMVKPKMVYISNSTETGTIYTKNELLALRKVCDDLHLYLFIDGARLAVALTAKKNDVTPAILGKVADIFYIGGTKNGFLSGEAIVFKDKKLCLDFRYHIKNKGAMLAKGFIVGAQFERAFKDNLYFDIATNSNKMANYIYDSLKKDVNFVYPAVTNQLFVLFKNDVANKIIDLFGTELWLDNGKEKVIRIVTSFLTTKEDCDALINTIKSLIK